MRGKPTNESRKSITGTEPVVAPLVFDPISAKLAEAAGFRALYLNGGSLMAAKIAEAVPARRAAMIEVERADRRAVAPPLSGRTGEAGSGDESRHSGSP